MTGRPIFTLRLDPASRARWEEEARKAGRSLADFIRAAVDEKIGEATSAPAPKPPPRRKDAKRRECPRARFHRPGTFCKECGGGAWTT